MYVTTPFHVPISGPPFLLSFYCIFLSLRPLQIGLSRNGSYAKDTSYGASKKIELNKNALDKFVSVKN